MGDLTGTKEPSQSKAAESEKEGKRNLPRQARGRSPSAEELPAYLTYLTYGRWRLGFHMALLTLRSGNLSHDLGLEGAKDPGAQQAANTT